MPHAHFGEELCSAICEEQTILRAGHVQTFIFLLCSSRITNHSRPAGVGDATISSGRAQRVRPSHKRMSGLYYI